MPLLVKFFGPKSNVGDGKGGVAIRWRLGRALTILTRSGHLSACVQPAPCQLFWRGPSEIPGLMLY